MKKERGCFAVSSGQAEIPPFQILVDLGWDPLTKHIRGRKRVGLLTCKKRNSAKVSVFKAHEDDII